MLNYGQTQQLSYRHLMFRSVRGRKTPVVYTGSDAFATCAPNHVLVGSPPSQNTNVVVFLSSRCVSSVTKLSQHPVNNAGGVALGKLGFYESRTAGGL